MDSKEFSPVYICCDLILDMVRETPPTITGARFYSSVADIGLSLLIYTVIRKDCSLGLVAVCVDSVQRFRKYAGRQHWPLMFPRMRSQLLSILNCDGENKNCRTKSFTVLALDQWCMI